MITVFYEDRFGGVVRDFGPHNLLLACLADRAATSLWAYRAGPGRAISGIPLNTNGQIKTQLRDDAPLVVGGGGMIAVYDLDQVHRLYGLPGGSCKTSILAAIRADVNVPFEVVFLDQNIETLLDASCEALGREVPLRKPNPNERDKILMAAATAGPEVRADIQARMPTFGRLVDKVAAHLA